MRLDPPLLHWLCAHQHFLPFPGFLFSSRLHLGRFFVLCGKSGLLDVRTSGCQEQRTAQGRPAHERPLNTENSTLQNWLSSAQFKPKTKPRANISCSSW